MITLGGDAELELIDSLDPLSEGVVFSVRAPKKSWKNIANLSGGEKTLSSLALVFALHHYKPTPLYVMDEIDAASGACEMYVLKYLDLGGCADLSRHVQACPGMSKTCPGMSRHVQNMSRLVQNMSKTCPDLVQTCPGMSRTCLGLSRHVQNMSKTCPGLVQTCQSMSRTCPGLSRHVQNMSKTCLDMSKTCPTC